MDKKSKIFFIIFFALIFSAVAASGYKYLIARDYYITAETNCDPEAENCFAYTCDAETDGECPEDPAEQVSYYKLITKKAFNIPLCDPKDENCPALVCAEGEDCEVVLCDEGTATEGVECNNPEVYKAKMAEKSQKETEAEEGMECDNESGECPVSDESAGQSENIGNDQDSAAHDAEEKI